jgi:hypothetical protein
LPTGCLGRTRNQLAGLDLDPHEYSRFLKLPLETPIYKEHMYSFFLKEANMNKKE